MQQPMPLKGKRSYGKIAALPPEVRNAVDNMLLSCTVRIPEIQAYIQEQAGVSVSESTVSRYGKRLAESYRDLIVAQENFEALRKEVEKYPEQDAAEVLLRIAIHKMMLALTSKTEKDWSEMRADKLMREISGVTRAVAYEGRHYTQYEATQQQKALESSIRQCKDRIAAAQEAGKLGSGELRSSRLLLRQLNAEYERFSAAAGLPTAPERVRAAGLARALKADGRLEMPQPAGGLKRRDGTLDLDTALRKHLEYLDTLTQAPERVKMYLDYYNRSNPTEYRADETLNSTFAYSVKDDVILYNPRAKGFDEMDFDFAALHETAHRADFLNIQSFENKRFREAIDRAAKDVQKNISLYKTLESKIRQGAMKDILSALSGGELFEDSGHTRAYWAARADNRALEIFAELFVLEAQNSPELKIVKMAWPELWKAYEALF